MSDTLINYDNFQPDEWDAAGATAEIVKAEITRLIDSTFGVGGISAIQREAILDATYKHAEAQKAMQAAGEASLRAASYADIPNSPLFKEAVSSRIANENIAKSLISQAEQVMQNAKADIALTSKLLTVGKVLGPAVDVIQVGVAAYSDDAYIFGQKAGGVVAGMAFGALAVAMLPVSAGVLTVAAISIVAEFGASKSWEWLWDSRTAEFLGINKGDKLGLAKGINNIKGLLDDLITSLQTSFNEAKTITSPIILDLDGNGVDTISKSAGVHFDLDGNKFAETTGWVGKNDGLLVLDRNGNGKIDNGSELFGNNTILKNGSKAAHGFAALSELDSNKDGKIDASDTAYSQLRVWKDSNSNGVVDTGELLTLTQTGVKSLNTGFTNQTLTDAQGNQHLQVGNYTRNDGSTRAMNDVWFATDTARTIAQDLVTINATIAALPELQGFGNVHSLRQAMARDSSGRLQTLVQNFIKETNSAARDIIMTTLLYAWVGVEGNNPDKRDSTLIYAHLIDARKVEVIEAFMGQEFLGTWCWGTLDPNPHGKSSPILESMFGKLAEFMENQLLAQTHFKSLYDSINLSWNSTTKQFDLDVSATVKALQAKYTANATTGAAWMLDFGNSLKSNGDFGKQTLATLQKQGNIAGQGFAFALATMGYNTVLGTASNDTLNGSNGKDNWLIGNAGNDNISGGNGNDTITGGLGNDTLNGGAGNDIYIFNKGDGQDTISDYDPTVGNIDTIRFGTGILPTDITLTRDQYNLYLSVNGTTDIITIQNWAYGTNYQIEKVEFANGTSWDKAKLLTTPFIGSANADNFSGTDGNDVFLGNAGNDNISGGNGNDTITGGLGNDTLNGGAGNDIYIFNKGDGQDTISDYDPTVGNIDTIRFGTGILPTDITLTRDQYYLYLSVNGTTDKITVQNWAYGATYQIEKVEFANGTSWDKTKLLTAPFIGSANADFLTGFDNDEKFSGNGGDDHISGNGGNDIIDGALGNDNIYGGAGSDTFTGGLGSDLFFYPSFADSPLAALDRITDFNPTEGDRIALKRLPSSVFNGGVFSNSTLSGAISAAYADANPNLSGNQALGANQAIFFGWNGGKYVSVNDGLAPFNANTDLVINVTGMTGTMATGALTPTNYFAV